MSNKEQWIIFDNLVNAAISRSLFSAKTDVNRINLPERTELCVFLYCYQVKSVKRNTIVSLCMYCVCYLTIHGGFSLLVCACDRERETEKYKEIKRMEQKFKQQINKNNNFYIYIKIKSHNIIFMCVVCVLSTKIYGTFPSKSFFQFFLSTFCKSVNSHKLLDVA
jgi:hypothetical protein